MSKNWLGGARHIPTPSPTPAKTGPTARDYDDSSWDLVDVPHDGIITNNYTDDTDLARQGYVPKNVTMYRKHFNLPKEWKGLSIWVYFEGIFRASTVYLNGQQLSYHDSGYTSFTVQLDTATDVYYGADGADNANVLVVRAIPAGESGWWYEGCGIYRHVWLVASHPVHILPDGLYGAANITGRISSRVNRSISRMYAESASFHFQTEVANSQMTGPELVSVAVKFTLFEEDGSLVHSVNSLTMTIRKGYNTTLKAVAQIDDIKIWSNLQPYLYTLQAEVMVDSKVVDAVNVSIGVRQTRWDSNKGFFLNEVPFIWRGFNNHNNFAGVGMAVPDRVNLFRAQSMRAVGANAWRMSHNPPIPVLLDILDRLGIIVWDENREFGNNSIWVENQKEMVRRDRNHPSVMVWSFCNERHCDVGSTELENAVGKAFRQVSYEEDPFRPVTANMNPKSGEGLTPVLDVQGLSHRTGDVFDEYHKQYPDKPLIGSECCSCRTQRGEPVTNASRKVFSSFNADCNQMETQYELNRSYVAGCMIWTLFDYYGEPTPYLWPHVSSSFGSIDLAGFAKASAYWYRSWWLYDATRKQQKDVTYNAPSLINPGAKSSEENTKDDYMIHIVQYWESLEGEDADRTIQVYSNGEYVELFINDKSQGVKRMSWLGWAEWNGLKYSPGTLTAKVYADSKEKKVLASHTRETSGKPAKLVAGVDVPNEATGTGSVLVLDGQDTGMVHAAIFDSNGNIVSDASHNVTFKVVSGPGRIIGVGNGDPTCHEPNHATWRSAYHGLARVIVQVTKAQSFSVSHRKRLMQIDRDGGVLTTIVPPFPEEESAQLEPIVVEASVEGLGSSQVTIPVSTDSDKDGILSVAKRWWH